MRIFSKNMPKSFCFLHRHFQPFSPPCFVFFALLVGFLCEHFLFCCCCCGFGFALFSNFFLCGKNRKVRNHGPSNATVSFATVPLESFFLPPVFLRAKPAVFPFFRSYFFVLRFNARGDFYRGSLFLYSILQSQPVICHFFVCFFVCGYCKLCLISLTFFLSNVMNGCFFVNQHICASLSFCLMAFKACAYRAVSSFSFET